MSKTRIAIITWGRTRHRCGDFPSGRARRRWCVHQLRIGRSARTRCRRHLSRQPPSKICQTRRCIGPLRSTCSARSIAPGLRPAACRPTMAVPAGVSSTSPPLPQRWAALGNTCTMPLPRVPVDTLTVGLAKEAGRLGIRVNAVQAGTTATEIHAREGKPRPHDPEAPVLDGNPRARGETMPFNMCMP